MEIEYKDRKLEKIIQDPRKLKKHFNQAAEIIENRLELLDGVDNLGQISDKPPTRLHSLVGDLKGKYAIDVQRGLRIVFEINHDQIPRLPDNSVDLDNISKIRIMGIYDYH